MKVFLFYLLREGFEPSFYAYTTKNEMKKHFLEERNPKMFYVKEVELSKKDFTNFERDKKEYELGDKGFVTKSSNNICSNTTHIMVTATGYEEIDSYSCADKLIYELGKHEIPFVEILNEEVLKALDDIYYFQIQKWINVDQSFLSGVEPFDFSSMNFQADVFAVFLYLYGYTMKK